MNIAELSSEMEALHARERAALSTVISMVHRAEPPAGLVVTIVPGKHLATKAAPLTNGVVIEAPRPRPIRKLKTALRALRSKTCLANHQAVLEWAAHRLEPWNVTDLPQAIRGDVRKTASMVRHMGKTGKLKVIDRGRPGHFATYMAPTDEVSERVSKRVSEKDRKPSAPTHRPHLPTGQNLPYQPRKLSYAEQLISGVFADTAVKELSAAGVIEQIEIRFPGKLDTHGKRTDICVRLIDMANDAKLVRSGIGPDATYRAAAVRRAAPPEAKISVPRNLDPEEEEAGL